MIENVVDIAAVAHVRARGPDANNVISRGDAAAGINTQGDVETACCIVTKSLTTVGRVVVAHCVVTKRPNTGGRVPGPA